MTRWILVLGLVACDASPVPLLIPVVIERDGTTAATVDVEVPTSGELDEACGPDVVPLLVETCLESTADTNRLFTEIRKDFGWVFERAGSGTVLKVGGLLDEVPRSEPVWPFHGCGADHEHQVRLLDKDGETWTFGWGLEGDALDGSTDGITLGAEIGFLASYQHQFLSQPTAMVLMDEIGPLFLVEDGTGLTADERGGFDVTTLSGATCVADGEYGREEHGMVSYTWPDGQADLRSSQSTTVPLPDRDLALLLARAFTREVDDWAGGTQWAAWAAEAP